MPRFQKKRMIMFVQGRIMARSRSCTKLSIICNKLDDKPTRVNGARLPTPVAPLIFPCIPVNREINVSPSNNKYQTVNYELE